MWTSFVLIATTWLIIKHFLLDFTRRGQPPWMFLNKGTYGHPGGIVHALAHAIGSLPIFIWPMFWVHWPGQIQLVCTLFVAELLIHYHMDWFKMWWGKRQGWSEHIPYHTKPCASKGPPQPGWLNPHLAIYSHNWFLMLGVDQLVHYLTYVGMVWAWTR